MASKESGALATHFESMSQRAAANPEMDIETLRSMFDELSHRSSEPENVTYQEVDVDGMTAIWCNPDNAIDDRVILYTHGGGFVGNTAASHRKLAGHLARAAKSRALVLEYRLAPEHPFPAAHEDSVTAYRWLVRSMPAETKVFLAGDSAGGNLAVSLPGQLKPSEPRPKAIAVFSPWVDMEYTGESVERNFPAKDRMLGPDLLRNLGQMTLGESVTSSDPRANPFYADLSNHPPLYIAVSSDEALFSDSERLAQRAEEAGVEVKLTALPDQQHVFPFMAGKAPEADQVIAEAGAWFDRHA